MKKPPSVNYYVTRKMKAKGPHRSMNLVVPTTTRTCVRWMFLSDDAV